MFSGLTRQEQRILLLLVGVIVLGLAIDYYKTSRRERALWVEVPLERHAAQTPQQTRVPEFAQATQAPIVEPPPPREQQPPDVSVQRGKIDINSATAKQLQDACGISQDAAAAIIAFRNKRGGIRAVEELLELPSVDKTALVSVLRSVYVAPAPPTGVMPVAPEVQVPALEKKININSATLEELKTLDMIGDVLARRIIEYRARNGPFRTPEDLMKVHGIGNARFEANKHRIVVK